MMRRLAGFILLSMLTLGCGDSDGGTPGASEDLRLGDVTDAHVGSEVLDDSATEEVTELDTSPLDGAGADVAEDLAPADLELGDVATGPCGPIEPREVFVVTELAFVPEDAPGVSRGFDLDGVTSDGADPVGCRKPDFRDAAGTEGIDNQFAKVLPIIEATGGLALVGLIQNAINAGDILILFELENVDDLRDDGCVGLSVGRGEGQPIVNNDDRLEAGQTFSRNIEVAPGRFEEAEITTGVLRAGPMNFLVPAYVFFYSFLLPFESGLVEMEFSADESVTGLMGGAIPVEGLIEQLEPIRGDGGASDAVIAILPGLADLFPDESGQCTAVSATLSFRAVPAFYYD